MGKTQPPDHHVGCFYTPAFLTPNPKRGSSSSPAKTSTERTRGRMGGWTPEGGRREGHLLWFSGGEGSLQGRPSGVLCSVSLLPAQSLCLAEATKLDCTPSPVSLPSPSLTLYIQRKPLKTPTEAVVENREERKPCFWRRDVGRDFRMPDILAAMFAAAPP